ASDVRRYAALPKSDGRGALAEVVLREADGCLSVPLKGTAPCVQSRARLVRALCTRLDRLTEPTPAAA
ncbi:restriction endonuclease, partial [Streptomyces sp. NPDC051546]